MHDISMHVCGCTMCLLHVVLCPLVPTLCVYVYACKCLSVCVCVCVCVWREREREREREHESGCRVKMTQPRSVVFMRLTYQIHIFAYLLCVLQCNFQTFPLVFISRGCGTDISS